MVFDVALSVFVLFPSLTVLTICAIPALESLSRHGLGFAFMFRSPVVKLVLQGPKPPAYAKTPHDGTST